MSSRLACLPRSFIRLACHSAMLLLAVLTLCAPARAQDAAAGLTLTDDMPVTALVPYILVTPDPSHALSLQTLYQRCQTGQCGDPGTGDIINLGVSGAPHWMVLKVTNRSWTERWVMTFGLHATGRTGLLDQVYLYDLTSQTRYIDNISPTDNPFLARTGGPTSIAVDIPRGKTAMFVMYASAQPGTPATLTPQLMTASAFAARQASPIAAGKLPNLCFAALAGFLIALLVFTRYWQALTFLGYFILGIAAYDYQNMVLYTDTVRADDIAIVVRAAMMLVGLTATKLFLNINRTHYQQNRLLWLFVWELAALTGLAVAFLSRDTIAFPALTLLPGLALMWFLVFLSLAQAQSGSLAAWELSFAWLCAALGATVSLLDLAGLLPQRSYFVTANWTGLVLQAVITSAALARRARVFDHAELLGESTRREDEDLVAQLRQTKEAADNQRLQRLIEHERQVMNALREREVQQSEEMRRAMDTADQANRAKSAFLAVISHEIRTPMTGILGMVRLLLDTALSREQMEYAQTIQDSGDAMLALLNDILDFEKIESGKMDLEHIDFDLHRVLQGIVTLMSGHAAAKKIELKLVMAADVPRFVIGDPVRLRQVLLNLSGNAIKFTSQGGVTLRIDVDNSAALGSADVRRLRFNIEDTGIGISPEAQNNLFTLFSQADSTVSRRFGGTGLGLAISQRLIEAMGGRIRIDSTPGQGSTFYFSLDMKAGAADVALARPAALASATKPERVLDILVVEDNEINQRLLKEFIDRFGHRVFQAMSGEDALQMLGGRGFDLILMDIELPGLSGMGTTRAIRALPDRTRAAIPVIALTGNVRSADVHHAYAANMNGHLAKPVDPKRLKTMIEKTAAGQLDHPIELLPAAAAAIPARETAPAPTPASATDANSNGMAPVRQFLLQPEDLHFTDDELDSDSFSDAMDSVPDQQVVSFDADLLNSLRTSMAPDQLRELVQGCLDKADELLGQLGDSLSELPKFVARTHELKGMAGNFGFVELQQLTASAEAAARQGKGEELPARLEAMTHARVTLGAAVEAWLRDVAAGAET